MSTFNKCQRIEADEKFIVVFDWCNPASVTICYLLLSHKHCYTASSGEQYGKEHCFPYSEEILAEIISVCTKRQTMQKAVDDSMSLVYQLCNKVSRGEL